MMMMMMPFGRFHWAALIRSWPGPRSCSNGPSSNSQWLSSALLSAQCTVYTVQLTMMQSELWKVHNAHYTSNYILYVASIYCQTLPLRYPATQCHTLPCISIHYHFTSLKATYTAILPYTTILCHT